MSEEALLWVVEAAPDVRPHWIPVLAGLARHADAQGRGTYPSQELLSEYARKSDRAVRNDLRELEGAGLIRPGDQSLADHLPPDRRPTVYDLATEKRRVLSATGWKPTSGRSNEATDRKHTSARSTGGNTTEKKQTRRSEENDRKHTSARTDRKHTSARSGDSRNDKTAGQRRTGGSTLPPKLSNYVSRQASDTGGIPIPPWAQPLVDALQMKGVSVSWGRTSNLQWVIVQQLIRSHGIPYLVHIASTRWNPQHPIRFGKLLIEIWREYPAPPVGSPWHPATQAARAERDAPVQLPPYCGDIDCDPVDRLREIETDDGLRVSTPCPVCHPSRKKDIA